MFAYITVLLKYDFLRPRLKVEDAGCSSQREDAKRST